MQPPDDIFADVNVQPMNVSLIQSLSRAINKREASARTS